MVSFRNWFLASTAAAMFIGVAGAQQSPTCTGQAASTPSLRAEGYTEQTGDILLVCSGGVAPVSGATIPQVNVAIFLNTQVTSRLLPISSGSGGFTQTSSSTSEALLMIDDPGSSTNPVAQTICTTPLSGCTSTVGGAATPNVYVGVVAGNSVTFFGVPVLAPGTTTNRTYRITNVRANATALAGGSAAGATPVVASISISGATALPINNATPTVGFVLPGLSASASGATGFNQCNSATRASANTLSFAEGFASSFKTRTFAQSNTLYAGSGNPTNQNVPGNIYFSESNLVQPSVVGTNGAIAGLADYGTRLKATFSNLPTGTRLFVSTTNVVNNALPVVPPSPIGGSGGNVSSPFAQLVVGETTSDGNAPSGFFPLINSTDVPSTGNTPIVEINVVNGSASAVWEVVNTNPNQNETFRFGVYTTYSSNVAQNSPPAGTATVNLSFAPTPPVFTAASGAAASSSLTIPRFVSDTASARNILTVNICRSVLLYPYVTNVQGFDTGLAIANTSTDPFGTGNQTGSCNLNWYQGANNPAVANTGTIASGTVYTTLASTAVPGFNGYMIAVCNFQYAHGFAFVSDLGAQKLAMGYLALVIPDPATNSSGRVASPLSTGAGGSGENIGH